MKKLITIAGNVGTGKTTLLYRLKDCIPNSHIFDEAAEVSVYLSDYFADMKKWVFHSRIDFLQKKLNDYALVDRLSSDFFFFDRGFDELQLFATHLYKTGVFDKRDYDTYMNLSNTVFSLAKPSDLTLYLYCSPEESLRRIHKRGNEYERTIDIGYIEELFYAYEEWSKFQGNLIRINTEVPYDLERLKEIIMN